MKIPKFLEKAVLNSDNVKAKIEEAKKKSETDTSKGLNQKLTTQYNKEIVKEVNKALKAAKKDWSFETVKAIDNQFHRPRKYITTSSGTETFMANILLSGKNYGTLSTLFSDSPGSIQCATRIKEAVLGGGYVIKPSVGGKKGSKKT